MYIYGIYVYTHTHTHIYIYIHTPLDPTSTHIHSYIHTHSHLYTPSVSILRLGIFRAHFVHNYIHTVVFYGTMYAYSYLHTQKNIPSSLNSASRYLQGPFCSYIHSYSRCLGYHVCVLMLTYTNKNTFFCQFCVQMAYTHVQTRACMYTYTYITHHLLSILRLDIIHTYTHKYIHAQIHTFIYTHS